MPSIDSSQCYRLTNLDSTDLPCNRCPSPRAPRTVSEIIGRPYLINGDLLPQRLNFEEEGWNVVVDAADWLSTFLGWTAVVWTVVISKDHINHLHHKSNDVPVKYELKTLCIPSNSLETEKSCNIPGITKTVSLADQWI